MLTRAGAQLRRWQGRLFTTAADAPRPNYGPAALFGLLLAMTLFVLRAATPFSFKQGPLALAFAAISTLPLGWWVVQLLAPDLRPFSTRLALVAASGLVVSIFIGFFLGVMGLPGWYLPVCLLALAGWLAVQLWRRRVLLTGPLTGWGWPAPSWWLVPALGLAGIVVAAPLMATLVRVSDKLFVDYAYIDTLYFIIRTHVLSLGAPAAIWPDIAGVKPLVYPDFILFWLGQLTAWSGATSRDVYAIYGPIYLILVDTLMLYVVGRELTTSRWGGYLAAALGYLVLWPNPYDSNPLMRNIDTYAEFSAARIHFFALKVNISQGMAGFLITGVALVLVLVARNRQGRSNMGLLTIASLLMVALLRVRSNAFVVAAPQFLLMIGLLAWRWRAWRFAVPVAVLGVIAVLIYLESSSPHYNFVTGTLAVAFSPFGDHAVKFLPDAFRAAFVDLPWLIKPFAVVAGVAWLRMIGLVFAIALLARLVQAARRRTTLTLVEVYLHLVVFGAIVAAIFFVRDVEAFRAEGGDFGAQALLLLGRVGLLLAIMPLWQLGRRVAGWLRANRVALPSVALGALVLAGVFTRQSAEALLHDFSSKAYPVTDLERNSYFWIMQNTPPLAVVAADPGHLVNPDGDTIDGTNFLSGMTERPAYAQRTFGFFEEEVAHHRALIKTVLDATSEAEVRAALVGAQFDYLLVYADHQPKVDLSCCMTLVFDSEPQVYARPSQ